MPVLRREECQGGLQRSGYAQVLRHRAREDHPTADLRKLRQAPAAGGRGDQARAGAGADPLRGHRRLIRGDNVKVILREDVQNLGKSGEVVTVKDGFGRNFLLPRKLAVLANEQNVRRLTHEKSVIEARQQKLKGAAEEQGKKISGASVKITRKVGE